MLVSDKHQHESAIGIHSKFLFDSFFELSFIFILAYFLFLDIYVNIWEGISTLSSKAHFINEVVCGYVWFWLEGRGFGAYKQ